MTVETTRCSICKRPAGFDPGSGELWCEVCGIITAENYQTKRLFSLEEAKKLRKSLGGTPAAPKGALCACGHHEAIHGLMGCEGWNTALDGEEGYCYCKKAGAR